MLVLLTGPRTAGPGERWEALDHLGVWDCYLGHVQQSKDVPLQFHQQWAEAYSEVLQGLETAMQSQDPIAIERAIKWVFVTHQLLLRLDGVRRTGRRMEAAMRRRFLLWHDGNMRELVELWTIDRAAAGAHARTCTRDRAAAVREAVRLINDGCLSKAMAYLGENGLGDMSLPEIKEQLRRKHPQERRAEWDAALINDTVRMELGDASGARDAQKISSAMRVQALTGSGMSICCA